MKGIIAFLMAALFAIASTAQTTVFTYQGKLTEAGGPANGTYLMQFKLYDAGGTQQPQPSPITLNQTVSVTNGIFTVNLDFGASPFTGADAAN